MKVEIAKLVVKINELKDALEKDPQSQMFTFLPRENKNQNIFGIVSFLLKLDLLAKLNL